MQHPRSSQPQSLHHHTSEHSEFFAIIVRSSRRSLGQTTHCKRPGPVPMEISTKTNARIQTHQNLFTLTKNKFVPDNQAGNKHPNSCSRQPSQEWRNKKLKLEFPCKYTRQLAPKFLVEMDGIEPTTPCLQSRCSTN